MDDKHPTHAGCVVFRDDAEKYHYLLISSSTKKHWVLPKGHIEEGERSRKAALRELKEEAGIVGKIVQPLSVQKYDKSNEQVVVQYYLVRMTGTAEPKENRKLRWERKKSALKKLSFKEARNALEDALEITGRMK